MTTASEHLPHAEPLDSCHAESRACDEPLAGSALTDARLLCVEHRGRWERDAKAFVLPAPARAALDAAIARHPGTRLSFVRQTGRGDAHGDARPLAVFLAELAGERRVRGVSVASEDALAEADLDGLLAGRAGTPLALPLFLVCTHGRRDACCARHGAAVYHALRALVGDAVWESSHQGGHRFAATLVALPSGHHYGRVAPEEAAALLAAEQAGRLFDLARYRGRAGDAPEVQVAEAWLRARSGELAASAMGAGAIVERRSEEVLVELVLAGRTARVRVREGAGHGLRRSSCGAEPEAWAALEVVGEG